MGIHKNEEADKAAKQATDIPGMTMKRLIHTTILPSGGLETLSVIGSGKTVLVSYTTLNHA